tara:strand:+ start:540 stop:1892 length:1353 start_codon:yes stop_codon:yes gene_type:complete
MRKYKGGGSSAPTETTVTNTDLPDYVEPYFKRLLQRGEAESLQGYNPYGGQRLSYFSPDELTSQAMTRGFATSGTPQEFRDASARYGATTGYGTPQYQAGSFDSGYAAGDMGQTYQAGDISSQYGARDRQSGYQAGIQGDEYTPLGYEENLQRFMSPYQQNVIDVEKREAARQSNIMGKGIGDAATAQGSLGGYREAIQQAERERNLGQQLGDIQTRGSQAGFQSAQQQLAAERAAGLGAAQFGLAQYGAGEQAAQTQEQLSQGAFAFGEQSRQQQEKLGQSGFQLGQQAQQQQGAQQIQAYQAGENARAQAAKLGLSAAQQEDAARQAQEKFGQSAYDVSNRYNLAAAQGLMGAGQDINQDAVSRIAALQGIGSQQRALEQASMDMGYEDFLRQQGFAGQQLGNFGNILRGVPVTPQGKVSSYAQQPGLFQQAIGAGLTGLGLYRGAGG